MLTGIHRWLVISKLPIMGSKLLHKPRAPAGCVVRSTVIIFAGSINELDVIWAQNWNGEVLSGIS